MQYDKLGGKNIKLIFRFFKNKSLFCEDSKPKRPMSSSGGFVQIFGKFPSLFKKISSRF